MHRFFLPPGAIGPEQVHFPSESCHQLVRVLHLRAGERVVVLDNLGREYEVELEQVTLQGVAGRVVENRVISTEPQVQVSLFLGLTQREKFEWVLQKGTEVGVAGFTPVLTSRSLVQDQQGLKPGDTKYLRWVRIVQEAAEQAGRGLIPDLHPPLRFREALSGIRQGSDLGLILWEGERERIMRNALRAGLKNGPGGNRRIALLIGPEGGLSSEEVDQAQQAGWLPVTLGPRILRMETAAVVAAALVLYELDALNYSVEERGD